MSKRLTDAELSALIRQLAHAYRAVDSLEALRAWGEQAYALVAPLTARAQGNNVVYWVREARVTAHYRATQDWAFDRNDGYRVFYGLAQARLELRKYERQRHG